MVLRINSRANQDEVKTPGKTQRPKRSKVRDSGDWILNKENLLFDPLRSYSQSAEEMEQSVTSARSWPYSLPLSPETGIMI
jgi:hypothetical protein